MRNVFLFIFSFLNFALFSQEKVEWDTHFNSKTKIVEIHAKIADGWHLYSQHVGTDSGPVATQFHFSENKLVKFIGEVEEPKAIEEYDKNFEATLQFFKDEVLFKQKVIVESDTDIELMVTFMLCNDVMCLPPVDKKMFVKIKIN